MDTICMDTICMDTIGRVELIVLTEIAFDRLENDVSIRTTVAE